MKEYLELTKRVLDNGSIRKERTGTGVIGKFGEQIRIDLRKGFPLLTTKKIHFKSVACELFWFLSGNTNVSYLKKNGVSIWNEWANEDGDLGPVYGFQWRHFGGTPETENSPLVFQANGVDQIKWVIEEIKKNPFSRRLVVSAWNPVDLDKMALPPCHVLFQFYVEANEKGEPSALSCHLYQRSADVFLGVPFNIASYALLTHLIAREVGLGVGDFVHSFGDIHIYQNHMDQVSLQLSRPVRRLPDLVIKSDKGIFDLTFDDLELVGYEPWPAIKAPVAV